MIDGQNRNGDQKGSAQEQSQVAAPTISLPKGGGAIRGIGEKFAANPVTGTGSMTVPIATSPGRSGFGPQLSLSYDSGSGNGLFGFGWSLSLPSITRKTDKGLPQYQDAEESDVFILSGAEDLVPEFEKDLTGNWVLKDDKHVIHDKPRTVNHVTYNVRRYRPRIEGLFARIERWTNLQSGEIHWRSISRENITTLYGKTAESRIADPADPARVFSWLICESYDDKGNVIVYHYKAENSDNVDQSQAHERNRTDDTRKANRYLKRVHYGNRTPYFPQLKENTAWPEPPDPIAPDGTQNWLFEVVFVYEDGHYTEDAPDPDGRVFARPTLLPASAKWMSRVDSFSTYRSGFEIRTYRLCQRVLMFHHFPKELETPDCLVRSTDFTYSYENNPQDARNPIFSFLDLVSQSGYVRQSNGSYLKKSLPPLQFTYTKAEIQEEVREVDPRSLENLPSGLDGATTQWVDLDGEGLSGILTEQAGAWWYKRNRSPVNTHRENGTEVTVADFAPLEVVVRQPSLAHLSGGRQQFLDLAGDGTLDLVQFESPTPGFYERTHDSDWASFRPFASLPHLAWDDPNLKFVDLTGDGHTDILLAKDDRFTWYPSLAEAGFGVAEHLRKLADEEKGPALLFADGTQSVYLADMSGDGLTDLVRIRNGEVCYWPNLGYGRFGAKVTMDGAPWFESTDLFDQQRVRLADIDGSGVTDIIYLSADGVRLYFNQSGNAWSEAVPVEAFPQVDRLSSVQVADLLGNGTACLVWSSPLPGDAHRPLRYVDLMGGQKPHLLVKTVNNLGAETHVHYAPSTKFYVADKEAGKPWITRLPFPVHVVERVETYDHISRNRFVTRYAYHHGYFDGEEREFRGFGLVEQWDTEEFTALSASADFPVGDNIDLTSHVPPVLTKTWFHTGVYVGRDHVSDFFAGIGKGDGEYYREPALRGDDAHDPAAKGLLLADTVLPEGLSVEEEREACRTLKGSMLRQEVYALDGTDKAQHPYTVTEQNFAVRRLQPHDGNRHGVFFIHAREAITYHYERNPADPRVSHALTLAVDDFGNVLRSVAVGYGRRQPDPDLAAPDQAKQTQLLITYTENNFTHPVDEADAYRTPLPGETRTYELTGFQPIDNGIRFRVEDFVANDFALLKAASDIPYEQTADPSLQQKRLIEHVRTLYRRNDLTDPLPLGQVHSLALPYESYKLAFTPGLLSSVYQRTHNGVEEALLPDPIIILSNEGRYVRSNDQKAHGWFPDVDPDDHWWIPSGQVFYSPSTNDLSPQELAFARDHFFLPHRFRDPFGHDTSVRYEDDHKLLVIETTDAVGNRVTATNDYRVL